MTTTGIENAEDHHARVRIMDQIAGMRYAKGWTQAELARQSGVHRSTVHRFERSADAWLSQVQRYARALGLELVIELREVKK